MSNLLEQISYSVEFGKINKASPFPPDMKDKDGADELTKAAIDSGIGAKNILEEALMPAMERVGTKFSENKIYVPQMLMSAKAMNAAMDHLKPFFQSGEVVRKGTFIIGTVAGDLHDIGKNLAAMMVEGGGWEIIDLGTDVKSSQFLEKAKEYPGCAVGLSALLTTTMVNMEGIVKDLKEFDPNIKVVIGGAPITEDFKNQINADFYAPDPQRAVNYLNSLAA